MEFTNILLEKSTAYSYVIMQCPLPLMDKTTVEGDYFCSLPMMGFSSSESGKFPWKWKIPLAFFTVYSGRCCECWNKAAKVSGLVVVVTLLADSEFSHVKKKNNFVAAQSDLESLTSR